MSFRLFSQSGSSSSNNGSHSSNASKPLTRMASSPLVTNDDESVESSDVPNVEDARGDGGRDLSDIITGLVAPSSTSLDDEDDYDDDDISSGDDGSEESEETPRERSGVVHIARIPPNMRADTLLGVLGEFGHMSHSHFVHEDISRFKKRNKKGFKGNRRRLKEGWVEYDDSDVAESVAASLNCTPMENVSSRKSKTRKSFLWVVKHLPYFVWDDLSAQKMHDDTVKQMRLQKACCAVTKQNERYMSHVYEENYERIQSKKEKRREKRKAKRNGTFQEIRGGDHSTTHGEAKRRRAIDPSFMDRFEQRPVLNNHRVDDVDPHLLKELM